MALSSRVEAENIYDMMSDDQFETGAAILAASERIGASIDGLADAVLELSRRIDFGLTSGKMGDALEGLRGLPRAVEAIAEALAV